MAIFVDDRAIVHENAKLGDDVFVGAYSIVGENCTIGDGTKINPHVIIRKNTSIGKNNKIYQFSSIGEECEMKRVPPDFDQSKIKNDILDIGDNNTFREFTSIHRGSPYHTGITKIGSNNYFTSRVHIGHDSIIGNYNTLVACLVAGHVELEDYCTIGGGSAIHQFCRIGSYAMVGGMTGVGKDILPYSLISCKNSTFGSLFGANIIGLLRSGFSEQDIVAIKNIFRIVRNYTGIQAILAALEAAPQNQFIKATREFIIKSEDRGILLK